MTDNESLAQNIQLAVENDCLYSRWQRTSFCYIDFTYSHVNILWGLKYCWQEFIFAVLQSSRSGMLFFSINNTIGESACIAQQNLVISSLIYKINETVAMQVYGQQ